MKDDADLLWPPEEMASLMDALARSADRNTLSYSEAAHLARNAAKTIRALAAPQALAATHAVGGEDLCECPKCGRMHRNLGFGRPPGNHVPPTLADLETLLSEPDKPVEILPDGTVRPLHDCHATRTAQPASQAAVGAEREALADHIEYEQARGVDIPLSDEQAAQIVAMLRTQPTSPLRVDEQALADFICETQDRLGPGCDELAIAQAILRIFCVRQASPLRGREPIKLEFSEQELAVIQELAEYHQLSQMQTLRQALRLYQLHEKRIRDGETFAWSGDKARAEEFAGLASPPEQPDHLVLEETVRDGKIMQTVMLSDASELVREKPAQPAAAPMPWIDAEEGDMS